VVIEKAGYEVTGHIYIGLSDARKQVDSVAAENARKRRANSRIVKELKPLERDLASKTRQLARCDDTARKTELETEIEELQQKITDKKDECEVIVSIYGPRRFAKEDEARAFVEQASREVEKAREKAEAKEQEEKEKADKT